MNHLNFEQVDTLLSLQDIGEAPAEWLDHMEQCPRCKLLVCGLRQREYPLDEFDASDESQDGGGQLICPRLSAVDQLLKGEWPIEHTLPLLQHLDECVGCQAYLDFLRLSRDDVDEKLEAIKRRISFHMYLDLLKRGATIVQLTRQPGVARRMGKKTSGKVYASTGTLKNGAKVQVIHEPDEGKLLLDAFVDPDTGLPPKVYLYEYDRLGVGNWKEISNGEMSIAFQSNHVSLVYIEGVNQLIEIMPYVALDQ